MKILNKVSIFYFNYINHLIDLVNLSLQAKYHKQKIYLQAYLAKKMIQNCHLEGHERHIDQRSKKPSEYCKTCVESILASLGHSGKSWSNCMSLFNHALKIGQ